MTLSLLRHYRHGRNPSRIIARALAAIACLLALTHCTNVVPPIKDLNLPSGPLAQAQLQALADRPRQCFALVGATYGVRATPLPPSIKGGGCAIVDAVRLDRTSTPFTPLTPLSCPMAAAYILWTREVVQPAARRYYGQTVKTIESWGSYACRPVNNQAGERLSEHATANALDVPGFVLADGRRIRVVDGWNGEDAQGRAFLRAVHKGACGLFGTVLGPDANAFHQDHIHLDMARWRYCR